MEGCPALDFWDIVVSVFFPNHVSHPKVKADTHTISGDIIDDIDISAIEKILTTVDNVPTTLPTNRHADLVVLEDNDAVIKMCITGRSPNMRHISRTHRVDLDWLFERLLKDTAVTMRYINTKQQLPGMFTKGSFTEVTWKSLLKLMQVEDKRVAIKRA